MAPSLTRAASVLRFGWLALLAAAPALAQEATTESGRWDARPSQEDFIRLGPPDAVRDRVRGSATVDCELSANGRPKACVVKSESPAGAGFGRAALKLAPLYKVAQTKEVQLAGSRLQFVIAFRYDRLPDPAAAAAAAGPPPLAAPASDGYAGPAITPPTGRLAQVGFVPGWQADFLDLDRISANGPRVEVYRLTVAAPSRDPADGAYELSRFEVQCDTRSLSRQVGEIYGPSGALIARRPASQPKVAAEESAEAMIVTLACDPSQATRIDAIGLSEALATARTALR